MRRTSSLRAGGRPASGPADIQPPGRRTSSNQGGGCQQPGWRMSSRRESRRPAAGAADVQPQSGGRPAAERRISSRMRRTSSRRNGGRPAAGTSCRRDIRPPGRRTSSRRRGGRPAGRPAGRPTFRAADVQPPGLRTSSRRGGRRPAVGRPAAGAANVQPPGRRTSRRRGSGCTNKRVETYTHTHVIATVIGRLRSMWTMIFINVMSSQSRFCRIRLNR